MIQTDIAPNDKDDDLIIRAANLTIRAERGANNFGKPPIDILQEYREGLNDKNAEIPQRAPMTDALSETIKMEAGAR